MKILIITILMTTSFTLSAKDCYEENGDKSDQCFQALATIELMNSSSSEEMEAADRPYCMQNSTESESCVYSKDL